MGQNLRKMKKQVRKFEKRVHVARELRRLQAMFDAGEITLAPVRRAMLDAHEELERPKKRRVRKQKRRARGETPQVGASVVPLRPVPAAPPAPSFLSIKPEHVAALRGRRRKRLDDPPKRDVESMWPAHPKSATPADATMAMDQDLTQTQAWAVAQIYGGAYQEGMVFLGYPALSEMAQRPEYRKITERIASEMTRKWIRFKSVSEEQEQEQLRLQQSRGKSQVPGVPSRLTPEGRPDPTQSQDEVIPFPKREQPEQAQEQPGEQVPGQQPPVDDPQKRIQESVENANQDVEREKRAEKSRKIKELEDEFSRLKVREAFKKIATHDNNFGRAHLYLDLKGASGTPALDDPVELMTPIGDGRNDVSKSKVPEGSLERLQVVEAIWCYPTNYNSLDPLRPDWYEPEIWFVQGKRVHVSRLLKFVGREVPDLLKPWYSFGGLPLIQMAKPYVDNWLRTRQSVSDLLHNFSTVGIKTQMAAVLGGSGADNLINRMEIYNLCRDNHGLMLLDKDMEEFFSSAVPLSTLDALQAQSQEQCASVVNMPLIIYLGIQPAGLNASSEGEIKVWDDFILATQESLFRENLTKVMHFVMLSKWGEVDEDITFDFQPLRSLDELQLADKRQKEAETDTKYIDSGVIRPEEARRRIADDPDSPYKIDPDDPPDLKQEEEQGLLPPGARMKEEGPGGEEGPQPPGAGGEEGGDRAPVPFVGDAVPPEFHEADHPRNPDGTFGSGGAASASSAAKGGAETLHPREFAAAEKAIGAKTLEDFSRSLTPEERAYVEETFGNLESAQDYYQSDDFKDDFPQMHEQITGKVNEKTDRGRKMFESYRDQEGVTVAIRDWDELPHSQRETWIQLAQHEHDQAERERNYKQTLKVKLAPTPGLSARSVKMESDAREFAKKMKMDPSNVSFTEETYNFTLNGKKMTAAGTANLATGKIKLYANHVSERTMYAVVAHEVIHSKFEHLLNKHRSEQRQIANMISASAREANPERGVLKHSDVFKPDSGLKPPYDEQFPAYHQVSELITDRKKMAKSDGVSAYSTEYWVQYERDKSDRNYEMALHETLAEMAANRVQTGSRGAKAAVWKKLYTLMEDSWPGGKSEPGWNKKIPKQEGRPT